jgi:hypothetical protein
MTKKIMREKKQHKNKSVYKKEKGFIMGRGEKPIIMLWPILNKHVLIY